MFQERRDKLGFILITDQYREQHYTALWGCFGDDITREIKYIDVFSDKVTR